jgi:putative membrane protein
MFTIEQFGFQALWSPYFLTFLIIVTISYFLLIGPWRKYFNDSEVVKKRTIFYFLFGIILVYTVKGSPVDLLGHLMFSAHMTQMSVLYLGAVPFLLLGLPDWFYRSIFKNKRINALIRFVTKPLFALLLFNLLFSFYHLPDIFDVVKTDVLLHGIFTSILFITAIIMWWPIVCPLPEMDKMPHLAKIGYIFANGMLLTPACALIIFAEKTLFTTYTDMTAWVQALELCVPASMLSTLDLSGGPEFFSWMPTLEDQKFGGIIMKIVQEIVYGSMLGYIFIQWIKTERAQDVAEEHERAKLYNARQAQTSE